jgi:hypothetical protein
MAAAGPAAAENLAAVPAPDEPAPAEPPRPVRPRPPEQHYPEDDDAGEYDDLGSEARRGARARALAAVRPPAICMLVASVLGLLGIAWFMVSTLAVDRQDFDRQMERRMAGNQNGRPLSPQERAQITDILDVVLGQPAMVFHAVFLLVNLVVLLGSIMMLAGRARWLGILASILALINLDCACCLLGIPFGIWSLVALSRPEVKATFR